jgi:hypothetical protein
VCEFDSSIPLSDVDGYDGVPVASEGPSIAGCPIWGPGLGRSFQMPMIFRRGAAGLGH